ncbi:MAG: hypothetical protein KAG89_04270 [Fulvimarina manganoxydans]|nr:hypothetical protein [Fulvimarina manganoxydans]
MAATALAYVAIPSAHATGNKAVITQDGSTNFVEIIQDAADGEGHDANANVQGIENKVYIDQGNPSANSIGRNNYADVDVLNVVGSSSKENVIKIIQQNDRIAATNDANHNDSIVRVEGDRNEVATKQSFNNNYSYVRISGDTGVGEGDDNTVTVLQTGNNAQARTYIVGDENDVEITQNSNNEARVKIDGDGEGFSNTVEISQERTAFPGASNTAWVDIFGDENLVSIDQIGNGNLADIDIGLNGVESLENKFQVLQEGENNKAYGRVDGSLNNAYVQQFGSYNTAYVNQYGTDNTANVYQNGNAVGTY